MMSTILRIGWLNLKRDRAALALTFILPIVFFSIFAMIFGGATTSSGPSKSRPLKVLVVDQDRSEVSRRLVDSLREQEGLAVSTSMKDDGGLDVTEISRDAAKQAVREGKFEAAVVIPDGFDERFGDFAQQGATVDLIYNPANPVAEFAVSGMLQASAFTASPDILFDKGMESLTEFGGELTPAQRLAVTTIKGFLRNGLLPDRNNGDGGGGGGEGAGESAAAFRGLIAVNAENARAADDTAAAASNATPMVPYYAAGIGVMFLLFSMAGAAGSILEEEETGALERLLMSQATLSTVLAGKWLFFALIGVVQVALMFIFASVVFGLDLWTANHLVGFLIIASITAFAASAFGLLLATVCRSRAQLSGLSTIVILIMSALGGSMVPRFFMPEFMKMFSRFTFNGWALDGFLAVFWNDNPEDSVLESLQPLSLPVIVMLGMTIVFLIAARLAARKWETV